MGSPRSIHKVVGPRGDPGRKGQPWQCPAGRPFWSDPVRRRPPVALGAASRAATLSSTVRPSRQAWGDPVLRRPAVQLGVTLPSAGRKSYTTAAFFSPVSVLLTRNPQLHEGEKKKPPTKPRRRRPNRLRVTLTLGGIKPYTRDLGPTSSDLTMSGGSACPPGPTGTTKGTCWTVAGRTGTAWERRGQECFATVTSAVHASDGRACRTDGGASVTATPLTPDTPADWVEWPAGGCACGCYSSRCH